MNRRIFFLGSAAAAAAGAISGLIARELPEAELVTLDGSTPERKTLIMRLHSHDGSYREIVAHDVRFTLVRPSPPPEQFPKGSMTFEVQFDPDGDVARWAEECGMKTALAA